MKNYVRRNQRALSLSLIGVLLVFAAGCAARHAYLVPTPTDNLTHGGHAAIASAEGVSITVVPNAWNGIPHDLYKDVTPLKVHIKNHSQHPLRVAYQDFDLQTPQGGKLAALPPASITGTQYVGENRVPWRLSETAWKDPTPSRTPSVVITPEFDWDDFYYAPYWGYGYVGLGPWPYAWAPDMGYYGMYYPYMRAIDLPTRSMLRKAIPEGVIARGGYVEGFLFFKRVNPKLKNVEFVAKLQRGRSGQQFGTIRIPFQVESK